MGMTTRNGARQAGNGIQLSSLIVNMPEPGPNTTSKTEGGQFDDSIYSKVVTYSGADQDSDSGGNRDTGSSERDRRGVRRERSEREVGHLPQCCGTEGLIL